MNDKMVRLAKKNGKDVEAEPMPFYYIEGKTDGRAALFISKKPGKSTLFGNVQKINQHIKRSRGDAFDKTSRLCVGQVTRVDSHLHFLIEDKKGGLAASQFVKGLKKLNQTRKLMLGKFALAAEPGEGGDSTTAPVVASGPKRDASGLTAEQAAISEAIAAKVPKPSPGQTSGDIDELYAAAAIADAQLQSVTTELAAATGGSAKFPPGLKGRERAEEKTANDYGGDHSKLTDLSRSSIEYESLEALYKGLDQISRKFTITKIKDRFKSPTPSGYRDILLNVQTDSGHICEMQLHLSQILAVKSEEHKIYEETRAIENIVMDQDRALTAEEVAKIREASKKYYDLLEQESQNVYGDVFDDAQDPDAEDLHESGLTRDQVAISDAIMAQLPSTPPSQTTANLDELYEEAKVADAELRSATERLAGVTGGSPSFPPGLKGEERAREKTANDYGGDFSKLTDLSRSSIEYKTLPELYNGLKQISQEFKITKMKDRFKNPTPSGYRDILLNAQLSNGHICELQLHLSQILEVKKGEGHKIYEETRAIENIVKDQDRPLTAEELTKIRAASKSYYDLLQAQSQEVYGAAFEDAQDPDDDE
jgi:hypothetical protein